MAAVAVCGSIRKGEKLVQPLRSFGPPAADQIQPMPYVAVQSMLDGAAPLGHQHYWKSAFALCYLQQLHGVAGRVAPDNLGDEGEERVRAAGI